MLPLAIAIVAAELYSFVACWTFVRCLVDICSMSIRRLVDVCSMFVRRLVAVCPMFVRRLVDVYLTFIGFPSDVRSTFVGFPSNFRPDIMTSCAVSSCRLMSCHPVIIRSCDLLSYRPDILRPAIVRFVVLRIFFVVLPFHPTFVWLPSDLRWMFVWPLCNVCVTGHSQQRTIFFKLYVVLEFCSYFCVISQNFGAWNNMSSDDESTTAQLESRY